MSLQFAPQPGLVPDDSLQNAIAWLNSQHALVYDGQKTMVWTSGYDSSLKRSYWRQGPVADFKMFYQVYTAFQNGKQKNIADIWLGHADCRRYRDVVFDPTNRHNPESLNLWRGFALMPVQMPWPLLRDHLYEIVANGNAEVYDYLIGWMAQMIQRPAEPAGTAIVMRGSPGAGKGIVARALGTIVGEHFVHIAHTGQLTSRFNGVLADALLVFADEAVWAGDRTSDGALKALITEPTIAIERKGREITTVKNVVHLIMASNSDWAAPLGFQDRRFCVLDVNSSRTKDRPYFQALTVEMETGGLNGFLYDLMHYDLSRFEPRDIPHTSARSDQMAASLEPLERWWHDTLYTGRIAGIDWPAQVECQKVYEDYLSTMTKWRVSYPKNNVWLGRVFRKLMPSMERAHDVTGSWVYRLPDIDSARLTFEAVVGSRMEWPPSSDQ